jgi:hypothetical protein
MRRMVGDLELNLGVGAAIARAVDLACRVAPPVKVRGISDTWWNSCWFDGYYSTEVDAGIANLSS